MGRTILSYWYRHNFEIAIDFGMNVQYGILCSMPFQVPIDIEIEAGEPSWFPEEAKMKAQEQRWDA